MGEERQDTRTTPPGRKFTVAEAAGALGISAEAVRSRLKRGSLVANREEPHLWLVAREGSVLI